MLGVKDQVIRMIQTFPDDITHEDVMKGNRMSSSKWTQA